MILAVLDDHTTAIVITGLTVGAPGFFAWLQSRRNGVNIKAARAELEPNSGSSMRDLLTDYISRSEKWRDSTSIRIEKLEKLFARFIVHSVNGTLNISKLLREEKELLEKHGVDYENEEVQRAMNDPNYPTRSQTHEESQTHQEAMRRDAVDEFLRKHPR